MCPALSRSDSPTPFKPRRRGFVAEGGEVHEDIYDGVLTGATGGVVFVIDSWTLQCPVKMVRFHDMFNGELVAPRDNALQLLQ